jgi:hypothetical protein
MKRPSRCTGFPTGGNSVVVLNSELRVNLFGAFQGIGFLDAGNVFPLASDLDFTDLRPAAGFGVAFRSARIGLVLVDLGFNLNPQEFVPGLARESAGRAHPSYPCVLRGARIHRRAAALSRVPVSIALPGHCAAVCSIACWRASATEAITQNRRAGGRGVRAHRRQGRDRAGGNSSGDRASARVARGGEVSSARAAGRRRRFSSWR